MTPPDPLREALNEAWKEFIATALRRNVVVAVNEHRALIEAVALAAQPEPLDVERLARAMVAYTDAPTTNPDAAYGWGDDAAAFIAREYAALSGTTR